MVTLNKLISIFRYIHFFYYLWLLGPKSFHAIAYETINFDDLQYTDG